MTTEQQKVQALIEHETQCFMARDFAKWSNCWVQKDYVSILECRPAFAEEIKGWQTISTYMKGLLGTGTTELDDSVKKSHYVFQIGQDMAFVRFEENGNASTRVLEKEDGQWKISHVGVVYTSQYKAAGAYIHDWETRNEKLEKTGLLEKH